MKKNVYVCGPTVYSSPHVGNMRPIISFDIYNRTNKYFGNKINFIHNITDIDDKIILESIKKNIPEKKITNIYFEEYKELLLKFNIIFPNHMPLVSENIDLMINFIQNLIDKKIAYKNNGNVYFDISKFNNYGNISGQNIQENKIFNSFKEKKNKLDFVV
jgi:cysteinyl-tRNA synthetase